jgi:DNA-binding NtrC family response regulator
MSAKSLLDGKKVLIVDDEPDVLATLSELLSMCQLKKASTFQEAETLLETENFDVAVLDIMGVDGYRLLEMANEKKIPAVMLTAHAMSPDNLVRSIREGAASFIPKDEMTNIVAFLNDMLAARKKGESTWAAWQERLPSSYFERKFGAAWQDADKEFWETFRAGLKSRKSKAQS